MSDSYDDYEAKIQLAEHAWEKRVDEMVKIEHDKQIEIAQAYERGWNAALAQQEPVQPPEWVGLTNKDIDDCYFAARQPDFDIWAFAAEIEEVLKQKNAWGNHLV